CLCLASPQEGSVDESHAAMNPCQLFSSLVMSMCCHIISTTAWSVNNFLVTGPKAYLTYSKSVQVGAQRGIEECKHQFAWDRWNCPESARQLSTHNGLRSATRETAFVHAISAAGVMYTLTKNCSMGEFANCGCDDSKIGKIGGRGWVWGGCSDNVDFGERIAKQFVDKVENGQDSRAAVNLHNNEAGRLAVRATLKRTCKCHGVSGSCSIQTCWMQLADFRDVGGYLKIKHHQARKLEMDKTRMRAGNSADNRGAITDTFSAVSRTELLYMEESPDYCVKNLSLGLHGTEGRECLQSGKNLSQWERRSCRRLCHDCGLKVEERRIETVSSCNCKFHCEMRNVHSKCDEVLLRKKAQEPQTAQQRAQTTTRAKQMNWFYGAITGNEKPPDERTKGISKAQLTYSSSVQVGAQSGLRECKHQFAWHRWNCPESALHIASHKGLRSATRETSFVHAISAAGVMYTLTRNCSLGDLEDCGCDSTRNGKLGGRGWLWGGCSDNVEFGERISKQYVDALETGQDSRAAVNLHNNEAGRLLSDFREVGNYLKMKHDQAQKLDMDKRRMRAGNSADNRVSMSDAFGTIAQAELIYLEDSPDYCAKNLSLGLPGTEGRECLQHGDSLSQWERRSCRRLCHECGLRVEERRSEVVSSCNCKFHWCCTVKCENCSQVTVKHVCARRHGGHAQKRRARGPKQ
ncbi:hypothetical protein DNTS_015034, partial [Danionella cerebrum]